MTDSTPRRDTFGWVASDHFGPRGAPSNQAGIVKRTSRPLGTFRRSI